MEERLVEAQEARGSKPLVGTMEGATAWAVTSLENWGVARPRGFDSSALRHRLLVLRQRKGPDSLGIEREVGPVPYPAEAPRRPSDPASASNTHSPSSVEEHRSAKPEVRGSRPRASTNAGVAQLGRRHVVQGHDSARSNRVPGTNAGLAQSAEAPALEAVSSGFDSPVQHHGRLAQLGRGVSLRG